MESLVVADRRIKIKSICLYLPNFDACQQPDVTDCFRRGSNSRSCIEQAAAVPPEAPAWQITSHVVVWKV